MTKPIVQDGIPPRDIAFLGVVFIFLVALLYSRFALSLSMFGFGVLALLEWKHTRPKVNTLESLKKALLDFWRTPFWWVITLHFFIVVLGGLYSDDVEFWLVRLRIKAPFLFLPMAFFLIGPIKYRTLLNVFYLLVAIMLASTLPVLFQMASSSSTLATLSEGRALAVPGNHIRYSLLIALATLAAVVLWVQEDERRSKWRIYLIPSAIFLFLFAHLIAVRSGLLCLYFGLPLLLIIGILKDIRRKLATRAMFGVVVFPIVAFLLLPSVKTKVQYSLEDWRQYRNQNWNAYSDGERFLSIEAGLALARKCPVLGVGYGNLRERMQQEFLVRYEKTTFLLPHNQYITLLASAGILGLIMFLIAICTPLVKYLNDPFMLILHTVILLSMLVENTLENAMGVAIYIVFLCILLNYHKGVSYPSS